MMMMMMMMMKFSYTSRYFSQRCGVGVGAPRSPGFSPELESLIWRRLRLRALSVSTGLLCNFVAVYLTFVQFILQLKLCLYTSVHLVLEEFKISLESFKYRMSHNKSWSRSRSPTKNNDSTSLIFRSI